MELRTFKAGWGMEGSWEPKMKLIAEAGYTGIETVMPTARDEQLFRELIDQYNLELILQVVTEGDHQSSFEKQVERAVTFNPMLINSHSAKDSMPYEEQIRFFEHALRIEKYANIPVGHETHRGRATFTPWSTARLLRDLPDLRLVADFSHWCCVCESLLSDQQENLSLAIERTIHIHARVGYEQGPQVPDFRASEYKNTLSAHEQWWDGICTVHSNAERPIVSMTTEFGPPGYMHTLPFTNQPVVDLWDICLAMKEHFSERFKAYFN